MEEHDLAGAPLGRLIAIAGHLATRYWGQYLAERHGVTPAGMGVLMALRDGARTHREVAERCFIRPGTLTGVIDTLERLGYVERRPTAEDRRTVRVALTEDGAKHGTEIARRVRENRPLTSVDADPEKAAVIRAFLLEMIRTFSTGEDRGGTGGRGPGSGQAVPEAR